MDIEPKTVRELLVYNETSGELFWRWRDRKWFKSDRGFNIWNKRWPGMPAFTNASGGYFRGRIFYRSHLAHRVAWVLAKGDWPTGDIDHINGNGFDNRIVNLRDVSPQINAQNRQIPSNNASGTCGVCCDAATGKWKAYIGRGKDRVWLGRFEHLSDAVAARKAAEIGMGYHKNHGRAKT